MIQLIQFHLIFFQFFNKNYIFRIKFNWIFSLIEELIKLIFFHSSSYLIFIELINSFILSKSSISNFPNSSLKFDCTEFTLNFENVLKDYLYP